MIGNVFIFQRPGTYTVYDSGYGFGPQYPMIFVELWGAGGAGAGASQTSFGGAGGGGGYTRTVLNGHVGTYTINVGQGGIGTKYGDSLQPLDAAGTNITTPDGTFVFAGRGHPGSPKPCQDNFANSEICTPGLGGQGGAVFSPLPVGAISHEGFKGSDGGGNSIYVLGGTGWLSNRIPGNGGFNHSTTSGGNGGGALFTGDGQDGQPGFVVVYMLIER